MLFGGVGGVGPREKFERRSRMAVGFKPGAGRKGLGRKFVIESHGNEGKV